MGNSPVESKINLQETVVLRLYDYPIIFCNANNLLMELLIRKYRFSLLLFIFLLLHIIPFLKRDLLRFITFIDYSVFLSLLLFLSFKGQHRGNPVKYAYYVMLAIFSLFLYFFGFAGSISGYILCATVPYFLFMRFCTAEEIVSVFFLPMKWASFCLIILGYWFFFNLIRRGELFDFQLMGHIFVISSINYVSLLFYGFSMMYVVFLEMKKSIWQGISKSDSVFGLILILSSIFFSLIYLTRSTFIASVLILIVYLWKYRNIMLMIGLAIFILFFGLIMEKLEAFMGSASVADLAAQNIRVSSAEFLIKKATTFNYDFTKNMSDSSVINLLFCFFPFSLVFLFDFVYAFYNLLMFNKLSKKIKYGLLLTTAIFIPLYQMDLLSIFALYIVLQYIDFEQNRKLVLGDIPSIEYRDKSD